MADLSALSNEELMDLAKIPKTSPVRQRAQTQPPTISDLFNLTQVGRVLNPIAEQLKQRIGPLIPTYGEATEKLQSLGLPSGPAVLGGLASGFAKASIPESGLGLGTAIAAGELIPPAIKPYLKRIAPSLAEFLFPITQKGAQRLAESPVGVAKFAALGEEGIPKAEVETTNALRKVLPKVLQDARTKFGETRARILAETGNPKIDASNILNTAQDAAKNYDFASELRTAHAANPQGFKLVNDTLNDVEEFLTNPKQPTLDALFKFRTNVGKLIRLSRADTTKGALGNIQNATDNEIKNTVGNDLFNLAKAQNEAYTNVITRHQQLSPFVKKINVAKGIAREVEQGTERGQLLKDLVDQVGDASIIDNIRDAIAAREFSAGAFRRISRGGSPGFVRTLAALPTFLPGAGLLGRLGLPTSPLGLARGASIAARTIGPLSRGLVYPAVPTLERAFGRK